MANPQSRLLALAAEAKQQYLAECAAGGEPAYPAWIEDALAVCGGGQYGTLARTGNTARDQEMYDAGIEVGEADTKHNAAIRAAAPGASTVGDAPAAYLTLDEEGSPCMLFFDVAEARGYCALGEEPEALYRRPAPAAGDALDSRTTALKSIRESGEDHA